MTIKILGALLILLSGSAIGWIIGSQYLNRIKELQDLQLAINILDTEMSYGQTFLYDALEITASVVNEPLKTLFSNCSQELKTNHGKAFSQVWKKSLNKNYRHNNLTRNDLEFLVKWGVQIGSTSLENQKKANQLLIKRLEQQETAAEEIADKRVTIVRYAGVLISLLVIILFY